jgi:biopolymer transport protein ExbB/TolQ
MNLTEKLLVVSTYGAEWILYLLCLLSIVSLGVALFKLVEFHLMKNSSNLSLKNLDFQLNKGLDLLGVIGNQSPFIGLLGTVIGIIQAFQALSLEEGQGLTLLMKGVAEALVTTGVGLFVALLSLTAYYYFSLKKEKLIFLLSQKNEVNER